MEKTGMFRSAQVMIVVAALVLAPVPNCTEAGPSLGLTASSAYLFDVDASRSIFTKAANTKRPPASTAKVLTALVVMDRLSLDAVVRGSENAAAKQPSKIYIRNGERFYVRDLLKALLIGSANDAATTLAEAVAGSETAFAKLMNEKARSLGARNSHFLNPHGLPHSGQYTTAHDLAQIMHQAARTQALKKIMKTKTTTIQSINGRSIHLKNHNKMMWRDVRPLYGKTGWTRKSRHCFTGAVEFAGKQYLLSTMGSLKPWQDLKKMLDYCFGPGMHDRVKKNKSLVAPDYVKKMQAILRKQGFDPGPIDGALGPKTVRAVIAFQRAQGLKPDGIVGPRTQAALAAFDD